MQKGVFTTWIKELCALVFVQTIQAFILAIVLSIILTFIKNTGTSISDQATVSSLGVLCIVLLTSLTKMEQITKKIFGLDSGILQHKPPHGLAATMLALKSAGRIFNNIPKIASGIGAATFGANLDKKKANSRALGKLQRRGLDKDGNALPSGSNGSSAETAQNDVQDDKMMENARNNAQDMFNANVNVDQGGIPNNNRRNNPGNSSQQLSNSVNSSAKKINEKDRDNYLKIMDQLDDDLSKAKEKRRKGIETAVSGLMETAGAGAGAMAGLSIGAVSGLATNDLDQIPKAMAYGIGVGDMAGESLTKAVSSVASGVKSRANVNKSLNEQISVMEKNLKINSEERGRQATRVKNIMKKIDNSYTNNSIP